MLSLPLESTHGRKTSGVALHHRLWTTRTIGQRWALYEIIALRQHTQSNDVRRGKTSSPFGKHTLSNDVGWGDINAFGQHLRSNDVRCYMPSLPLDSTHGRTTSSVALHHRPRTARTVRRRRAWYDITALGQHTRSATSGVA